MSMVVNMQEMLFYVIALITLTIVMNNGRFNRLTAYPIQWMRSLLITKVGFVILLIVFFQSPVHAQYIPATNQAFQLTSVYNPAFSGVDRFGDIRLGFRKQWSGFPQAPQFLNLSYNFRLKQPVDLKHHGVRTGLGEKLVIPHNKQMIMGAGIHFFNEKVGPIDRLGGGVTYSANFMISEKWRFASGVGVFVENTKIDYSNFHWGENVDKNLDEVYVSLQNGAANQTQLNARVGVLLYSSAFYIGVSYFPFVQNISSTEVVANAQYYKATVQAGVSFQLSPEVMIRPSVVALLLETGSTTLDYHTKIYLRDKTWFGAAYRSVGSGVMSLGMSISPALAISYSYEFSTGKFSGFGANSQDVMLVIRLNNFRKEKPLLW